MRPEVGARPPNDQGTRIAGRHTAEQRCADRAVTPGTTRGHGPPATTIRKHCTTQERIFVGTKKTPAKTQTIYKIPGPSSRVKRGEKTRSPPTTYPDFNERLQAACLSLTNCPRCKNLFVLSESTEKATPTLTCASCGLIPREAVPATRAKQLAIISTAVTEDAQLANEAGKMSRLGKGQQDEQTVESDEYMKDLEQGDNGSGATKNTLTATPDAGSYSKRGELNNDGNGSQHWVLKALGKLEDSWSTKWASLESEVACIKSAQQQGFTELSARNEQTEKRLISDIEAVKSTQLAEAQRAKTQEEDTRESLNTIAENQQVIAKELRVQKDNIQAMKNGVLKEIQDKLAASESVLQTINSNAQSAPARGHGESYADKAARAPGPPEAQQPIGNYLEMEIKQPTPRPTATQTNGNLARLYVKDWPKEPVGAVKRALRQTIATWATQQAMMDNDAQVNEVIIDIDSVRHLNQFGTPENPIMEISCTPERVGLVKRFFQESEIPLWNDDINPLMDPEVAVNDKTLAAAKRHSGHFIRVLTAWWKAAHYVQNRDTADFYTQLVGRVVQSPEELHAWHKHITGVYIDARGVEESKKNPKVWFNYAPGYESLAARSKTKQIVVRSFATGGTRPSAQATKRLRPDVPTAEDGEGMNGQQIKMHTEGQGVAAARTPTDHGKRVATVPITPARPNQNGAEAEPSTARTKLLFATTPAVDQTSPGAQLSQYFNLPSAEPNPPPATPPTRPKDSIQVSVSGRKLAQGPRAGSRTAGVETHC